MPKIVILGSCRHEPYEILAVPVKNDKWNTEEGYKMATQKFYPAIEEADEVWVYAPDGIGEHTSRDIEFAMNLGRKIVFIRGTDDFEKLKLEKLKQVAHKHVGDPLDFLGCFSHLIEEYAELVLAVRDRNERMKEYDELASRRGVVPLQCVQTINQLLEMLKQDIKGLEDKVTEELADVANCSKFTYLALRKRRI